MGFHTTHTLPDGYNARTYTGLIGDISVSTYHTDIPVVLYWHVYYTVAYLSYIYCYLRVILLYKQQINQGLLLLTWINFQTPAWISDYIQYKIWDENYQSFSNFSGEAVRKWISNFRPHFTGLYWFYQCFLHAVLQSMLYWSAVLWHYTLLMVWATALFQAYRCSAWRLMQ